jgi:hypothetical protein
MDKKGFPCVFRSFLKIVVRKTPAKHPLHFRKSGAELCMKSWSQPSNFGTESQVKHLVRKPGSLNHPLKFPCPGQDTKPGAASEKRQE